MSKPSARTSAPKQRLRPFKLVVQPYFLLDDGKGAPQEVTTQPITVPADGWPEWAQGGYQAVLVDLERQILSGANGNGNGSSTQSPE